MVKSPEQRLTVSEMLEHPWIRGHCADLEARVQPVQATSPVTAKHLSKNHAVSFDKHKGGHVTEMTQGMTRLAV